MALMDMALSDISENSYLKVEKTININDNFLNVIERQIVFD
jgi:hypothetical protein